MLNAILGVLLGAAAGFLIGQIMSKIGLGCPLICNPKISTIYFAFIGLVIALG
jgi:hypothetical protein